MTLFIQNKIYSKQNLEVETSIARSWIEINFNRLENNVRNIKASLPKGVKYVCVVKADAYGHCMPQALMRFLKGGADAFAVANLYEASRVRELVSDKPVLILSPILKEERPLVFDFGATPSVSSVEEAEAFSELALARGVILDVHIKLDSGMGRAGVRYEVADDVIPEILKCKGIRVAGIFSHLSSADSDKNYTLGQFKIFKNLVSKYGNSDMLIHLHNSAALQFMKVEPPFNAVRVGLIQYGINPHEDPNAIYRDFEIKPVLEFKSRILAISENSEFGKIATVSAGYADGVPSGFNSDARVLVNGIRCPLVGKVGLDETIIDITNAGEVNVGDEVVFIGEQSESEISLVDYSKWTSRIPWETMVAIPRRVKRILTYK